MQRMRIAYHKFGMRIIASAMVCLFTFDTIAWACPDLPAVNSRTLATQIISNPSTDTVSKPVEEARANLICAATELSHGVVLSLVNAHLAQTAHDQKSEDRIITIIALEECSPDHVVARFTIAGIAGSFKFDYIRTHDKAGVENDIRFSVTKVSCATEPLTKSAGVASPPHNGTQPSQHKEPHTAPSPKTRSFGAEIFEPDTIPLLIKTLTSIENEQTSPQSRKRAAAIRERMETITLAEWEFMLNTWVRIRDTIERLEWNTGNRQLECKGMATNALDELSIAVDSGLQAYNNASQMPDTAILVFALDNELEKYVHPRKDRLDKLIDTMRLLQDRAPYYYELVKRYTKKIEMRHMRADWAGVSSPKDPFSLELNSSLSLSTVHLAGTLVHENEHNRQQVENLFTDVCTKPNAEMPKDLNQHVSYPRLTASDSVESHFCEAAAYLSETEFYHAIPLSECDADTQEQIAYAESAADLLINSLRTLAEQEGVLTKEGKGQVKEFERRKTAMIPSAGLRYAPASLPGDEKNVEDSPRDNVRAPAPDMGGVTPTPEKLHGILAKIEARRDLALSLITFVVGGMVYFNPWHIFGPLMSTSNGMLHNIKEFLTAPAMGSIAYLVYNLGLYTVHFAKPSMSLKGDLANPHKQLRIFQALFIWDSLGEVCFETCRYLLGRCAPIDPFLTLAGALLYYFAFTFIAFPKHIAIDTHRTSALACNEHTVLAIPKSEPNPSHAPSPAASEMNTASMPNITILANSGITLTNDLSSRQATKGIINALSHDEMHELIAHMKTHEMDELWIDPATTGYEGDRLVTIADVRRFIKNGSECTYPRGERYEKVLRIESGLYTKTKEESERMLASITHDERTILKRIIKFAKDYGFKKIYLSNEGNFGMHIPKGQIFERDYSYLSIYIDRHLLKTLSLFASAVKNGTVLDSCIRFMVTHEFGHIAMAAGFDTRERTAQLMALNIDEMAAYELFRISGFTAYPSFTEDWLRECVDADIGREEDASGLPPTTLTQITDKIMEYENEHRGDLLKVWKQRNELQTDQNTLLTSALRGETMLIVDDESLDGIYLGANICSVESHKATAQNEDAGIILKGSGMSLSISSADPFSSATPHATRSAEITPAPSPAGETPDNNVSCGTICEAGHQKLLDTKLEAFYKSLIKETASAKTVLSEKDVINALNRTGRLSALGMNKKQLESIIAYIHEKGGIPDDIAILPAIPNLRDLTQQLWWIDNPRYKPGSSEEPRLYAGGHFRVPKNSNDPDQQKRIHISLPLIASILTAEGFDKACDAALAIAQHDHRHIKTLLYGEVVPKHDESDPGIGLVANAAASEAIKIKFTWGRWVPGDRREHILRLINDRPEYFGLKLEDIVSIRCDYTGSHNTGLRDALADSVERHKLFTNSDREGTKYIYEAPGPTETLNNKTRDLIKGLDRLGYHAMARIFRREKVTYHKNGFIELRDQSRFVKAILINGDAKIPVDKREELENGIRSLQHEIDSESAYIKTFEKCIRDINIIISELKPSEWLPFIYKKYTHERLIRNIKSISDFFKKSRLEARKEIKRHLDEAVAKINNEDAASAITELLTASTMLREEITRVAGIINSVQNRLDAKMPAAHALASQRAMTSTPVLASPGQASASSGGTVRVKNTPGKISGENIFTLGIGTVWFGRDFDPQHMKKTPYVHPAFNEVRTYLDNAFAAIGTAHDGKIAIDTSASYGDSEEMIGRYFQERPTLRSKAFIATKWGEELNIRTNEGVRNHSKKHLIESVAKSIERLGNIDLLYIHRTTKDVLQNREVIDEMKRMKTEHYGGINYIGASISHEDVLEEGVRLGLLDEFDTIQIPASLLLKRNDLVTKLHEKGIAIVIGSPINRGGERAPADIFADLLQHKEVSVILTGSRNHFDESLGYVLSAKKPSAIAPAAGGTAATARASEASSAADEADTPAPEQHAPAQVSERAFENEQGEVRALTQEAAKRLVKTRTSSAQPSTPAPATIRTERFGIRLKSNTITYRATYKKPEEIQEEGGFLSHAAERFLLIHTSKQLSSDSARMQAINHSDDTLRDLLTANGEEWYREHATKAAGIIDPESNNIEPTVQVMLRRGQASQFGQYLYEIEIPTGTTVLDLSQDIVTTYDPDNPAPPKHHYSIYGIQSIIPWAWIVSVHDQKKDKVIYSRNNTPPPASGTSTTQEAARELRNDSAETGRPVNVPIDISLMPREGEEVSREEADEELDQAMETLAYTIAHHNKLGLNTRYTLFDRTDGQYAPELQGGHAAHARTVLAEKLRALAERLGHPTDYFDEKLILHTAPDTITVPLMDMAALKAMADTHAKMPDNEYPVALRRAENGARFALPNYTAAAGIGLAYAGLVAVKEDVKDGSLTEAEYDRQVKDACEKIGAIYARWGVDVSEFTATTLKAIIGKIKASEELHGPARLVLIAGLNLALPPVIVKSIETLRQRHEAIREPMWNA